MRLGGTAPCAREQSEHEPGPKRLSRVKRALEWKAVNR